MTEIDSGGPVYADVNNAKLLAGSITSERIFCRRTDFRWLGNLWGKRRRACDDAMFSIVGAKARVELVLVPHPASHRRAPPPPRDAHQWQRLHDGMATINARNPGASAVLLGQAKLHDVTKILDALAQNLASNNLQPSSTSSRAGYAQYPNLRRTRRAFGTAQSLRTRCCQL